MYAIISARMVVLTNAQPITGIQNPEPRNSSKKSPSLIRPENVP